MSIYHDLDAIKDVALSCAKEHQVNYNVILMNPDENGNFSRSAGSTYEFVRDSYFEKKRPNVIKLFTTDSVLKNDLLSKVVLVEDHWGPTELNAALHTAGLSHKSPLLLKSKKSGIDTLLLQSIERERERGIKISHAPHKIIVPANKTSPAVGPVKIGGYSSNHRNQKKSKY